MAKPPHSTYRNEGILPGFQAPGMSRKLEVQDRLHVELNEEVFFAPKLMQADEFPSGAREGEIRGFVTDVQRRGAPQTEQQTTQEREEKYQVSHMVEEHRHATALL